LMSFSGMFSFANAMSLNHWNWVDENPSWHNLVPVYLVWQSQTAAREWDRGTSLYNAAHRQAQSKRSTSRSPNAAPWMMYLWPFCDAINKPMKKPAKKPSQSY
jgi:hypothetical protein